MKLIRAGLPVLVLPFVPHVSPVITEGARDSPAANEVATRLARLPLLFVENHGQLADTRIACLAQAPGGLAFCAHTGVTVSITRDDAENRTVSLTLPRAVDPVVERRQPTVISYFRGPREAWHTGLPTFGQVRYAGVWPEVDLVLDGSSGRLELVLEAVVGAHADSWASADRWLRDACALMAPVHGEHDDDPELAYCGYLGGGSWDSGDGIAVDTEGHAYVTGWTRAAPDAFPTKIGPSATHSGKDDAFVAKLNASGTGLVFVGYIGGDDNDWGYGIGVDGDGNVLITGETLSGHATFPTLVGPDVTFNGVRDTFVTKISADGTDLLYSGYIGGDALDYGHGLAVDATGHAYVAGRAASSENTFPVERGPDLTHNGGDDAFVAKVAPDGSHLLYCGYIGGAANDGVGVTSIAIDDTGRAYVAGYTRSSQETFPVAVGPDLIHNGAVDGFVAKVEADGKRLIYCGYIGGAKSEWLSGLALDAAGQVYVVGETWSDETTFPVTVGPDLTFNGGTDTFVTKVAASGKTLVYSGFVGGAGVDKGRSIAVDRAGRAWVTGRTASTESTFPISSEPSTKFGGGGWDAFVTVVAPNGATLLDSGYLGGSGIEGAQAIVVDDAGDAYMTGYVNSDEATFPTVAGPSHRHRGGYDVFVAKLRSPARRRR